MSALWNLVAQQDNIISRSIAEESRTIALGSKSISEQARLLTEQSVKLATDTKDIANFTMGIADATKRDSTSMVAIATLTVIFLPLSFVATLLGMPIFNWQAKTPETIVKRSQILIYVYSALPLMLVVVLLWACWLGYSENRRNAKKGGTDDAGATEREAHCVNAASASGMTDAGDASNTAGVVDDVIAAKNND